MVDEGLIHEGHLNSAKQSAVGRSVAGVREKMDRRTAPPRLDTVESESVTADEKMSRQTAPTAARQDGTRPQTRSSGACASWRKPQAYEIRPWPNAHPVHLV